MKAPEPTIRVNVDVTNPGQFFACCGLLELTARIDPASTGQFASGVFELHTKAKNVLEALIKCDVTSHPCRDEENTTQDDKESADSIDSHRGRTYPMTLGPPFELKLEWWNDEQAQKQKLKTWTAGQRVTDLLMRYHKKQKRRGVESYTIIPSMRDRMAEVCLRHPDDWIRAAHPVRVPMAFSYDSRLSRNNGLDLGHQGKSVMAFSPAVDVLTLIALQRFRPWTVETWTRNRYCTWKQPLTVEIAAVATLGLIPELVDLWFEFPIKARDAERRYKLFGHAQPVRRPYA